MRLAGSAAIILGLPLVLLVGALATGHLALWAVFVVVELVLFKVQGGLVRGIGSLYDNRRGLYHLEKGDAASAVRAFERAHWFGRGGAAYVNNLALAHVYTGDVGRARELLEPAVADKSVDRGTRAVLMSTWAMVTALLGELETARAADSEAVEQSFSVAAWIIAARERRWPFTRPAEMKGAWTRHLFDVLEAFVAAQGYRDRALTKPLPIGLARALAYRWPEMKAFLGS
ncbi:MAG: hypothetical protein JWP87_56 [Labilithrix sp.]|nr:hypothetical protein [Labilithrix sp.]